MEFNERYKYGVYNKCDGVCNSEIFHVFASHVISKNPSSVSLLLIFSHVISFVVTFLSPKCIGVAKHTAGTVGGELLLSPTAPAGIQLSGLI